MPCHELENSESALRFDRETQRSALIRPPGLRGHLGCDFENERTGTGRNCRQHAWPVERRGKRTFDAEERDT